MKKIISAFLSLIIVIGIITSVPITVNAASGSAYTSSSALAAKLDQVFSGDIDIFSNSACTTEVSMPVGTSMSNGTQYWVKSNTTGNTCSGWQCYIYANAVYNKLFNEWVGHGASFSHSQNVITSGKSSVSYSDFVNAGVHTGAYIRTTNQSSGAYNGSSGHSMIVLSYDSSNITYLEGNGDGNGAVRITTKTWSAFNTSQLSGKSRYISHVVQPTESYYQSLYKNTESPLNIGDNFYGVILNKGYWKPIHLNSDTSVTLETEAGIANQLWYFDRQDDGSYVISSTLNGNALEMQDGNTTSGTQTVCKTYWGGYYQAWYIYSQGNGCVFVSKHYPEYNLALTLSGNNSADGTKITTETRNNGSSQIWNVYSTDEVQLKATTLYAAVGDSATDTVFTWDNTYGECAYDLKIWKDEVWSGDAYHLVYSATSGCGVQLPAGTYQAYVDTFNHYECKMSNVVTFTVPEKTCNILYNANGGSGTMSGSTVNYSSEFSLKPSAFTQTGYSFVGWNAYRNSDGKWFVEEAGWQTAEEIACNSYTKKVYQDSVMMTFNDSWFTQLDNINETDIFTFYAVWKPESYRVEFDDNDGDSTDLMLIDTVTYNSTFGELPTPTRNGYTFNGWYTAPTGGTKITSSTVYTTASGITLYAHWTKNHSHSYTGNVTKAPTCTETGVRTYKCSCGASYTQTISATGHSESSWITNKKATVYSVGEKYKECTECGEILETATIKQLKCSKPKLKTIANTQSGVKITWGKVSGADTYRVYRKTKNGDWKYLGYTSKTGYTDRTAKSGTKYYYAVRARNEAGNSSLSSSLSKYYLADPTLKTPKSTKSGISLKWTKTTGAQGYIIYRKTGNGSYKKLKTEKGVSNLSYVDKSAKKGKKYTYKVKAYYSKTYSAYSNTKTIKDKY